MKKFPSFKLEKKVWDTKRVVIGVDEVGRGAFAGPLVAGALVFHSNQNIPSTVLINDSKQLSKKQREHTSQWLCSNVYSWGIGEASVSYINAFGIAKATQKAFRSAVKKALLGLPRLIKPFVLADAFHTPYLFGIGKNSQKAVIKGDGISLSIAGASIIAKVYRDRFMEELDEKAPIYDFTHNKGYGTLYHREQIKKYGVSKYHRFAFVKNHL